MKRRNFAFIAVLFIVCCMAQAVLAKPQFKNFKQWYGKDRSDSDVTFIEFTVVDRNWEVANKKIYISLYDNKRRLIDANYEQAINFWREFAGKPRLRIPKCTWGVTLTDTGPDYNNESFVKYTNGQYRVRTNIGGRHQIASYRMQW